MNLRFLSLLTRTSAVHNEIVQLAALIKLSALNVGYLPWTSSSMTPKAVNYILNEILVNKKRQILELGMGVSTILIAALLDNQVGAQLISVDHDQDWIEQCKAQIQAQGLHSFSHSFIHAPLVRSQMLSHEDHMWYDQTRILEFPGLRPDMLIIDGPPAWRDDIKDARIPAYAFFSKCLSENATVVIDDYRRIGENVLLGLFESDPGWKVVLKDKCANVAILRRSNSVESNSF